MKNKITITIPAQAPRRHFAPPVIKFPDLKKKGKKKACRGNKNIQE